MSCLVPPVKLFEVDDETVVKPVPSSLHLRTSSVNDATPFALLNVV